MKQKLLLTLAALLVAFGVNAQTQFNAYGVQKYPSADSARLVGSGSNGFLIIPTTKWIRAFMLANGSRAGNGLTKRSDTLDLGGDYTGTILVGNISDKKGKLVISEPQSVLLAGSMMESKFALIGANRSFTEDESEQYDVQLVASSSIEGGNRGVRFPSNPTDTAMIYDSITGKGIYGYQKFWQNWGAGDIKAFTQKGYVDSVLLAAGTGSTKNPANFTSGRIPFTTGANTIADSGNLTYNNSTGTMTVTGRVSITSPTGTTSTTSAPAGSSLAPLSITGGQGGLGNNASGSSTGGNANEIRIMGGQGGNASSSTTAIAGKGADVIINAGDGGLTFGTATTKVAGGGGKAIMQGGSSTGGESGGVDIKGGNTTAIGGIGGRVRIFGGVGNNESAGATDDSQYAGIVQLNISNNDAPRGRTLIAVKESDADFTNRLQVGGNARITGTVTAPTFAGNATSATNWGGSQADFVSGFGTSLAWFAGADNTDGKIKPFSASAAKGYLATSFQDVTNVSGATSNFLKITGSNNVQNGEGLELFTDGSGSGLIQAYDRGGTNTYKPLIFTASEYNFSLGSATFSSSVISNEDGFISKGSQASYNLTDRTTPSHTWALYANFGKFRLYSYNGSTGADVLTANENGVPTASTDIVNKGYLDTQLAGLGTATSGTYTPTITNQNNTTSLSVYGANYVRVGNIVTVNMHVAATIVATGQRSDIKVTLPPISTSSVSLGTLFGTGSFSYPSTGVNVYVYPDGTSNNSATIRLSNSSVASATGDVFVTFTYVVN